MILPKIAAIICEIIRFILKYYSLLVTWVIGMLIGKVLIYPRIRPYLYERYKGTKHEHMFRA